MTVVLKDVTRIVGAVAHISEVSLTLEPGTLNVLLGPTLLRQDLADAPDGRARPSRPRAASS